MENNQAYIYIMDISGVDADTMADKLDSYKKYLSDHRWTKLNKLRYNQNKLESLSASLLLAYALKEQYGLKEAELSYDIGKRGKPFIKGHPDIYFNLSHTTNLVAVICAGAECGIDAEVMKAYPEKVVHRVFGEAELRRIKAMDESDANREFIRMWTRREAVSKLTGDGILFDDELQAWATSSESSHKYDITIDTQFYKDSHGISAAIKAGDKSDIHINTFFISNNMILFHTANNL